MGASETAGSNRRHAACLHNRRKVLAAALTVLPLTAAHAAEPAAAPRVLTDEEMAARVARKAELLKSKGKKKDAVYLFGADYQKGVRSTSSTAAGFKPDTSPNLRK